MRIALTGASGFIGLHLGRRLLAAGHHLRILARRPVPDLEAAGSEVVTGALDQPAALDRLVDGADCVIHAAGLTSALSAAEFARINTEATRQLVLASRDVSKFLLVSSLAAREPLLSDYAASKHGAEEAVVTHRGSDDWTILRPPAVYGPGDKATLDIFRLMKRGFLVVPPQPAARFSLIYVEDLCRAIEVLLTDPVGRGAVLDVRDARTEGYGWSDVAAAGSVCFGHAVRRLALPKNVLLLTGHMSVVRCQLFGGAPRISPGKVRELCHIDWVSRGNPIAEKSDWVPEVGITEGFRRTLDWYRSHDWL